jgi:hypothetical protein
MTRRPVAMPRRVHSARPGPLLAALFAAALMAAAAMPLADPATAQAVSPTAATGSVAVSPSWSVSDAPSAGPDITWSVAPATGDRVDTTRNFYDYSAKRGVGLGDHVAITNYSAQPITLHVYAADGTTDFKTGKLTLISGTKPSKGLGSWVSVARGPSSCPALDTGSALAKCLARLGVQLTVRPNTSVIVPFRIAIPKNATAGDHVAGIVAAYTVKGAGKHSVAVEERVGARIYLRVAGKLSPGLGTSGAVAAFHTPSNPFGSGSATIGFDLTDTGNTRLSALPSFAVTGIFGIPAGTATARPVENLLPGGVAHVQATVTGVPQLLMLFGGIAVTPERADGDVGADTLPAAIHATVITWAVPWIWLLILFVAAGLAVGVVWWRRRSNMQLAGALQEYALQVQAKASSREVIEHDLVGGDSESPR